MMSKYNNKYYQQLQLLITILPEVAKETCFCIKGGTAINLFYTDMPRISVDIDLVYLPINAREVALQEIEDSLLRIKNGIENTYQDIDVNTSYTQRDKRLKKLYVSSNKIDIVIEPNFILRGSLFPKEKRALTNKAVEHLNAYVSDIPVLSRAETYAGKICAALDRQHPRDLFDIKVLDENGGINDEIRQAFVIYLACSPRPIHELLNPNLIDIESVFKNEFVGMTTQSVDLHELLDTRIKLITEIRKQLTNHEKEFLLSIKSGQPKWELMPFENLDTLPALRWKLVNIQKMDKSKQRFSLTKLMTAFER